MRIPVSVLIVGGIFLAFAGFQYFGGQTTGLVEYRTVEECRLREAQKSAQPVTQITGAYINRYCLQMFEERGGFDPSRDHERLPSQRDRVDFDISDIPTGVWVLAGLGLLLFWIQSHPPEVVSVSREEDAEEVDKLLTPQDDDLNQESGDQSPARDVGWWIAGLISASYLWAVVVTKKPFFAPFSSKVEAGLMLGFLGPILLGTGVLSFLVHMTKKNWRVTMWTWTISLAVTLLFLSVGAVQMSKY